MKNALRFFVFVFFFVPVFAAGEHRSHNYYYRPPVERPIVILQPRQPTLAELDNQLLLAGTPATGQEACLASVDRAIKEFWQDKGSRKRPKPRAQTVPDACYAGAWASILAHDP